MKRRHFSTSAAVVAASLAAWPGLHANAQEAPFPSKPIRIVVGIQAGGALDIFARTFARHLSPLLGQPVVIDNRPGASGMIAAAQVLNAEADGHTLLMTSTTTFVLPLPTAIRDGKVKFGFADFTTVSVLGGYPMILYVSPQVTAANLKELGEQAKRDPGKFAYGTSGKSTMAHVVAEKFRGIVGAGKMLHVPYQGAPPIQLAVMTNQVQFSVDAPAAVVQLTSEKKVRAIATLARERSPFAPDVPTAAESGMPDLLAEQQIAAFIPAKTPAAVAARVNAAFNRILSSEAFKTDAVNLKYTLLKQASLEENDRLIKDTVAGWEPAIRAAAAD